jgi:hypothetical protein
MAEQILSTAGLSADGEDAFGDTLDAFTGDSPHLHRDSRLSNTAVPTEEVELPEKRDSSR